MSDVTSSSEQTPARAGGRPRGAPRARWIAELGSGAERRSGRRGGGRRTTLLGAGAGAAEAPRREGRRPTCRGAPSEARRLPQPPQQRCGGGYGSDVEENVDLRPAARRRGKGGRAPAEGCAAEETTPSCSEG
eukprot:gene13667-biopygen1451